MLITRTDLLFLREKATTTELVDVTTIPPAFQPDFNQYFFGKTLLRQGENNWAYPHDIQSWVRFMMQKYSTC